MKKILLSFLALSCCFAVVSCENSQGKKDKKSDSNCCGSGCQCNAECECKQVR